MHMSAPDLERENVHAAADGTPRLIDKYGGWMGESARVQHLAGHAGRRRMRREQVMPTDRCCASE